MDANWWFWPAAVVLAPLVIAAWGALFMAGLVGIAYVRLRVRECIAGRTARADERERRRAELAVRARRLTRDAEVPAYLERRRQRCEVPGAFRAVEWKWGE